MGYFLLTHRPYALVGEAGPGGVAASVASTDVL